MKSKTQFCLVAGSTRTATIDGISAAGADPEAMRETPAADAELVVYGDLVRAGTVPVSPTGCPTPAVFTRAISTLLGLDVTVVDGGLLERTGAPTVSVGASPGGDIRDQDPVPSAPGTVAATREVGRALPGDELFVAETIPGGTTTALGVLRALGEEATVSSSLPENPLETKQSVVEAGLEASNLSPGDAAGDPSRALRRMGDPVLAAATGLALGALETDVPVTLAGGTQMLAVAALLRHAGIDRSLSLATTPFVLQDDSADVEDLAADLEVSITAIDPEFEAVDHPALSAYVDGEAKEGVGFGGALALADRAALPMATVRDRSLDVYDRLVEGVATP